MIRAYRLAHAAARTRPFAAPRLRRAFSWSDFNPLSYFYGSKNPPGSTGQAGGSSGQAGDGQAGAGAGPRTEDAGGSDYVAAGYIAPTPVVVDLRNADSLIDDSEEPLKQVQNFGRMARLLFLRYHRQALYLASKFVKSLLEDYYEYGLLLALFFLL